MKLDVYAATGYIWEALGFAWLIGLAFTKRTAWSQPLGGRLFQMAAIVLGFFLLCSPRIGQGWLGARFLPETQAAEVAGIAMTAAGCLFAIWARIALGGNWSGRATVKESHELIVNGPYALARHPIYTGLLAAALGTALAEGEWRCILGLLILFLALTIKMRQEERLMMATFPQAYPLYRQRVKALIPGLL